MLSYLTSVNRTEVGHVGASVYFYRTFRYDVFHVNPPLTRYITGLPILLTFPQYDWKTYSPRPQDRSEWSIGSAFINANTPEKFHWCIFLARCSLIPIILLGGYVGCKFASELYGQPAGIIFLLLWTFSPFILGWGATICPDVCAASLGIIGVYMFWHWLKNPTWSRTIIAGTSLGFLLLAKITWVIAFPLCFLIWLFWVFPYFVSCKKDGEKMTHPKCEQLAVIFIIAIYVLNMGYSFDGTFRLLRDYKFISQTLSGVELPEGHQPPKIGNRFEKSLLGYVPVPLPAEFVQGIDTQKLDFERGLESYFRGKYSQHGWWYYYVYMILVKEPLGNLCLGVLALFMFCFSCDRRVLIRDEVVIILPAVILFVFISSQTGFSIHPRYIVLVLPFVYIWLSRLGQAFSRRQYSTATITAILLFWSVVSSVSYLPYSMSYFNELIGGANNAPKHLLGSNIDWGQNVYFLKRWYLTHPEARPIRIVYSDSGSLERLDIKDDDLLKSDEPVAGWFAIGVNELYGSAKRYEWLKQFAPIDRVGYSIYIYRVTPEDANRLRKRMNLPELEPGNRQ
ncbi:MAG: hypothetical protein LBJ00_14490 [Planctomycetaceae bacterium]|nr:hypothetical protein [Planctomycetaceae bacterium]